MDKISARGSALGKIILMGEHSVVYGQPAIAIPFPSARIDTRLYKSSGGVVLDCFSYKGPLLSAPENFLGLREVIKRAVEELGQELNNFTIEIESTIPAERGMGSSAAVSAATVRAIYSYFKKDLSSEKLIDLVNFSEKIVHGNPSGIDTAIVVGQRPLYYIKGKPLEVFDFKVKACLLVADTGQKGRTKYAVSKVKQFIDDNPKMGKDIIASLGQLTKNAKLKIKNQDIGELAKMMNQAQIFLKMLGVSNEKIDELVDASIKNGALAAKLTGGGLGGCIISLCRDGKQAEDISQVLLEKGAKNTWILNMED